MNAVTNQRVWSLPTALAWRQHEAKGSTYWFNFRTNTTAMEVPAELPSDMVDDLHLSSKTYWHNEVTGRAPHFVFRKGK